MATVTGQGQNSIAGVGNATAAAAAAAAAKAKKIAELKAQILTWETKLKKVKSQMTSLTTQNTNLNTYLGEWETQKKIYNESATLSEVVIVNVFEGVCADKIKVKFQKCITTMNGTYNSVNNLTGIVSLQIARLKQYETYINSKLTLLKTELSSL